MLDVLFPRRNWGSPRVWQGIGWCLAIALVLAWAAPSQARQAAKKEAPAKTSPADSDDDDTDTPKSKGAKTAAAKAGEGTAGDDSAQTRKIVPNEVFRDPIAEKLLDVDDFKPIIKPAVTPDDLREFKAIAGGANPNVDKALIERVIDAMVAKLTDRTNIQALIDMNAKINPNSPTAHAIQEATSTLIDPLFAARGISNDKFLVVYNRLLIQKLVPLLKNHLIPRVQAMIILGESGSTEMLPIYEAQIKDKTQTVWVKLWAMEGMANIIETGGRLNGTSQVNAAKVVADFLENDDVPWPAQLRGLEVLTAMREGFEPNRPNEAAMASVAMRLLSDTDSKPEVRAEAARALGMMRITGSVPKYNYALVAHSIGELAADLAAEIETLLPDSPVRASAKSARAPDEKVKTPAKASSTALKTAKGITIPKTLGAPPETAHKRSINPARAKYLTALLVGPVYQAFDGMPNQSDAGLTHSTTGAGGDFVQKVFDLVKPVAKSTVDLLYSGQRQIDDRKKELKAQIAALRSLLEQNEPADRHLVANGKVFPVVDAAAEPTEEPVRKKAAAPAANTRKSGRRAQ